ncbi:MAG: hypothetical protein JSS81_00375 [Acidobacteria bacterium]|nr:hypothetical protein [Acidobacteriota bacterium]
MANQIEIELRGPGFTQSAVEISRKVAPKSISKLFVYNATADSLKALEGALEKLSPDFAAGAAVLVVTSQNLPRGAEAMLGKAAKVPVRVTKPTTSVPFSMTDQPLHYDPAENSIMSQLSQDAQKQQAERWKIMKETQNRIFEITQDVTVNKARTADKMYEAMDNYIRN